MPTFENAGPDVRQLAASLIVKHHPAVADAEVDIGYQMAYSKSGEPAVSHHGWPALAVCKLVSAQNRQAGMPDILITIDGDRWNSLTAEKKAALLDHELHHILPQEILPSKRTSPDQHYKLDSQRRPVCRLRPHDWQFGGFDVIHERHGAASEERRVCELLARKLEQKELPFEPATQTSEAS